VAGCELRCREGVAAGSVTRRATGFAGTARATAWRN